MAEVKDVTIVINVQDKSIKKAKETFDKMNKSIADQEGLLGKLQKKEELLLNLRKRSNDPKAIQAFNRELEKTRSQMNQLTNTAKKQETSMSKLTKSIGKMGLALGGAFAIKAVVTDAIKRIVDFEKSISSLSAITGATGKDLGKLKGIVLQTAKETKKGGAEIAKAFELVGSAQPQLLKNADALALVTKNAITLSKASGLDLTAAVAATTTGLAQFNIAAEDSAIVIDALAAGAKFGASAIPETTAAIEKFGAVANNANVSIAEAVALTETLATKQLTGAEAGNNLKNIILKLQNAGLGFVDGQFNINAALEETRAKFDAIEDPVKRSQAQTKLFGLESATAGAILLNNIDTFQDFSESIGNDVGGALIQAGIQMDNVAGKVEELDATYDAFILSIDDGSGVISEMTKGAIEGFTGMLESLTDLNQFDFGSLFNPENFRDFANEALDLSKIIGGVLDPSLKRAAETIDKVYNLKLDAANQKLKDLSVEQLENGRIVNELVKIYAAQGISQDDARLKIRNELAAREDNDDAIKSESEALDANTIATDTNTESKKKSLNEFQKLIKFQADLLKGFDEELKAKRILSDTDEELEEEEDEDFLKLVGLDEEGLNKLKEAKEKKQEIEDDAELIRLETDLLNQELQEDQDKLFAETKASLNEQLGFSALSLASTIAGAASDSQEAQLAALALEKLAAVASIVINTAKANALLASQLGVASPPAIILNNINGALQVATVLATAIPQAKAIQAKKLKEGEIMIQGAGTETSDSIPIMASKNESVIKASMSKKHTAALRAINDDRFDEWLNRVVMQQMYMGNNKENTKIIIDSNKKVSFPKSMRISNAKEISEDIVNAMNRGSLFNQGQGWA